MSRKPYIYLLQLGLVALACHIASGAVQAQEETPPIIATIAISNPLPYEKESVELTLTIQTVGIQLRKQLDLVNLPDKQQFDLFSSFETMPTQRTGNGHRITEIHRYRCQARALKSGQIRIAPTLRIVAMRRRRMFIGSAWEEFPLQIKSPPVTLDVKAIPSPPAHFSGAIGPFSFTAAIAPSDIVEGDLVTLTTRLAGSGYTDGLQIPKLSSSARCKVYDPQQTHSGPKLRVHEQIVIPQSVNVTEIPSVSITIFNTTSGNYETISRGPFPITYHAATDNELQHFRPEDHQGDTEAPSDEIGLRAHKTNGFRAQLGNVRYKQATCLTATTVYIAPSARSLATFELEAKTEVNILKHRNNWLLIASDNRRGWIRKQAVQE